MRTSRDRFDLKRRHFRVVWREAMPNGTTQAYEQFIDYPRLGVTFMLGKNGAGKSTLLQGLADLAEGNVNTRCEVSLICDPTAATEDGWNDYRAELEHMRADEELAHRVSSWIPRFVKDFGLRRYSEESPREVGGRFRGKCAREILLELGYTAEEISADIPSAGRSITTIVTSDEWPGVENEIPERPAVPVDPHWVLLDMMAECEFDAARRSDISYTRGFTNPAEWLDDPDRLALLRKSVSELCETVQLEFRVLPRWDSAQRRPKPHRAFRYVGQVQPGGALQDVLRLLDEEMARLPRSQWGPDHFESDIWPLFPHGLFSRVMSPNGPSAAGPWMSLPTKLFSLVGLSPDDHSLEGISRLESKLFDATIGVNSHPDWDDEKKATITVKFAGFEQLRGQLEVLTSLLSGLDAGIGGLRVAILGPGFLDGPTGGLTVPSHLRIEWLDTRSGTWRLLEHCSDGQRRVLALFLGLLTSNQGAHPLLLADEFDRTLHPVLARQTAQLLSELSQDMGGLGIFSTHDVSLATTTPNPPWEMTRHVDGTFRFVDTAHPRSRAENLGVTEADLRTMTRMVVLVEGYHDELIVNHWLPQDIQTVRSVQVIQANGIKNVRNLWDGHLRLLSCPILVVHDKRLPDLEDAVARAKEVAGMPDAFDRSGLGKLRAAAKDEYRHAALEMKSLVDLLESAIKDGALDRLVVHGIDVEDIVDCLPFDRPFRTRGYTSWEEAHQRFRENGGTNGNVFKDIHNINNDTVSEALAATDTPHPELVRLYDAIMSRVGLDPFSG